MNNIQKNHFIDLPDEYTVLVLSHVTKPHLFPENTHMYDDCFNACYIRPSLVALSQIALVCKDWERLQHDNLLWKAVFYNCTQRLRHDINFSSDLTYKNKVVHFFKNLEEQRTLYNENGILIDSYIENIKYRYMFASRNEYKEFLNFRDFANQIPPSKDLFDLLIANKKIDEIAKLILFKPKLPGEYIAYNLFQTNHTDFDVCFDLLVKLNYNSAEFFKKLSNFHHEKRKDILTHHLLRSIFTKIEGLRIRDYIRSGCKFNLAEEKNSFLITAAELLLKIFYDNSDHKFQYQSYAIEQFDKLEHSATFQDEQLKKYIRKEPFSELEVKNIIFDLLVEANLKLNQICPAIDMAKEGTALSQLEQIASSLLLPQPNAFSQALIEYDEFLRRD
ncbi:MAG: F-box-like domain-containing protein [Candidatus Protochlamydia sp.]|nr:F-box-like domain-containing protein [Candidatus Protochlamydia sp.]